jgi:hypothetical protein
MVGEAAGPSVQSPKLRAEKPVMRSPLHDFAGSLVKAEGLPQAQRCAEYQRLADSLGFAHASLSPSEGRAARRSLIDAMNSLPADETSGSRLAAPLLATFKTLQTMSVAHDDSYLALDPNCSAAQEADHHENHLQSYTQTNEDQILLSKLVTKHGLHADMNAMTTLMEACFDPKSHQSSTLLGAIGIPSMVSKVEPGKLDKGELSRLLNQLADKMLGAGGLEEFVSADVASLSHMYGLARDKLQSAADQHGIDLSGDRHLTEAMATLARLDAGA